MRFIEREKRIGGLPLYQLGKDTYTPILKSLLFNKKNSHTLCIIDHITYETKRYHHNNGSPNHLHRLSLTFLQNIYSNVISQESEIPFLEYSIDVDKLSDEFVYRIHFFQYFDGALVTDIDFPPMKQLSKLSRKVTNKNILDKVHNTILHITLNF